MLTAAEIAAKYVAHPDNLRDLELDILRHMEHHIKAAIEARQEKNPLVLARVV